MIYINDTIQIPDGEIEERFVRSSGPGGQNVNKVSTAVHIRFNVKSSTSLPSYVKHRIFRLFGNRISNEGFLAVNSDIHRTQMRNREESLQKLVEIIRKAAYRPKVRRPTKMTYSSKMRRMDSKRKKSDTKKHRRSGGFE
jgi:ribosome-associated protein